MKFTSFQTAIFDAVRAGESLLVDAVAGSGKTTTLLEIANCIQPEKSILLIAFNKRIQEELEARCNRPNTSIKTFHGFGLGELRKVMKVGKVQSFKIHNIVTKLIPEPETDNITTLQNHKVFTESIVRLYEMNLLRAKQDTIEQLISSYEMEALEEKSIEELTSLLVQIESIAFSAIKQEIAFVEMLSVPALKTGIKSKFDYVLVDEAQDLNPLQILIINKLAENNEQMKLIVVGDARQSIYGFAGAKTNSLALLQEKYKLTPYDLPQSFRCPLNHIELAQTINPKITAVKGTGELQYISEDEFRSNLKNIEENALIICRRNAPLVKIALSLLKLNKRVKLLGDGLERNLSANVYRISGTEGNNFLDKCERFFSQKREILNESKKKNKAELIAAIDDMQEIIEELYIEFNPTSTKEFVNKIYSLFKNLNYENSITLSSIHRAKGTENDSVYYVEFNKVVKTENEENRIQEQNLKYVAFTRSKNKLVLIATK